MYLVKPLSLSGQGVWQIHNVSARPLNAYRGKHRSGEKSTLWTNQYRSRPQLSESFEGHWSIPFPGDIRMDQSLVHTFSWGNSSGPMVLKVLQKFPPTLVLVHGWLFPAFSDSEHPIFSPLFKNSRNTQRKTPWLFQHVLTVLVFRSWVLLLPRLPPWSRSLRLFPWASIFALWALGHCLDLLPATPPPPVQKKKTGRTAHCFTAQGGTRRNTVYCETREVG